MYGRRVLVVRCGDLGMDDRMDVFVQLNCFQQEIKPKIKVAAIDRRSTRFENLLGDCTLQGYQTKL